MSSKIVAIHYEGEKYAIPRRLITCAFPQALESIKRAIPDLVAIKESQLTFKIHRASRDQLTATSAFWKDTLDGVDDLYITRHTSQTQSKLAAISANHKSRPNPLDLVATATHKRILITMRSQDGSADIVVETSLKTLAWTIYKAYANAKVYVPMITPYRATGIGGTLTVQSKNVLWSRNWSLTRR